MSTLVWAQALFAQTGRFWWATFFGIAMFVTAVFLMLLVLVQRGRGGGLAGAFGGMGGQSAFGAKAGDTFTKITIWASTFWILLCMAAVLVLNPAPAPTDAGPPQISNPANVAPPEGTGAEEADEQDAGDEQVDDGASDDGASDDGAADDGAADGGEDKNGADEAPPGVGAPEDAAPEDGDGQDADTEATDGTGDVEDSAPAAENGASASGASASGAGASGAGASGAGDDAGQGTDAAPNDKP